MRKHTGTLTNNVTHRYAHIHLHTPTQKYAYTSTHIPLTQKYTYTSTHTPTYPSTSDAVNTATTCVAALFSVKMAVVGVFATNSGANVLNPTTVTFTVAIADGCAGVPKSVATTKISSPGTNTASRALEVESFPVRVSTEKNPLAPPNSE